MSAKSWIIDLAVRNVGLVVGVGLIIELWELSGGRGIDSVLGRRDGMII